MDRKKIIEIAIIIAACISVLAFLFGFVWAQGLPMPIVGQIKGVNVPDSLIIRVTNLRSSVSMDTTSAGGYYLVEWANSPQPVIGAKFQNGDQFKAEIVSCNTNPACVQTATYTGQGEINLSFDLSQIPFPCPTCTVNIYTALAAIIAAVVASGVGIRIYKKRTGEAELLHKHYGIISYHSPNTVHTNANIRHPKGMLAPKYENGKYVGGV